MAESHMEQVNPSDRENFERLLHMFKSTVSFGEIASVYCQSGRNMHETQKKLSIQSTTPRSSSLTSMEGMCSANSSNGYQSDFPKCTKKQHPTSVGSVSGVVGKDYDRQLPSTSTAGAWIRKPMVLNSANGGSVSDLEDRNDYDRVGKSTRRDIEGFLFEMLGNGFSLDKTVIHDILGQCGYDVEQSMDKLMNMSLPPTTIKSAELGKSHSNEVLNGDYPAASLPTGINIGRVDKSKAKRDLEKEILSSLFKAPERTIDEPVKIVPMSFRPIVKGPLRESLIDYQPIISRKDTTEKIEETNDNDYDLLRKAVSEYKTTMKEYYTAAAIAFGNREYEKAQKLREEGDFFMKKSKEADDKSAKKLVERDDEEDLTFDFQEFEPETVSRFLKVQLSSLAGITSFKYLKVKVGNNDGKSKHASRKRRILRLLEKEHIEWTEEGDGWTVVIQLSKVKLENLSFARK